MVLISWAKIWLSMKHVPVKTLLVEVAEIAEVADSTAGISIAIITKSILDIRSETQMPAKQAGIFYL
jgi:hypothetical protein